MYFKSIIPNVIISTCNRYKTYNEIFYIPILSLQNGVDFTLEHIQTIHIQVFSSHMWQVATLLHSMRLKVFVKSEVEELWCRAFWTTTANIQSLYLFVCLLAYFWMVG